MIRLEIEHKADKTPLQVLKEQLAVSGKDVSAEIAGPLDLTF